MEMSPDCHDNSTPTRTGPLLAARTPWQRPVLNVENVESTAGTFSGSIFDGSFTS
ncbi:hypothetical protein [Tistrella mobilis]|uniref:hypothetical protein n=1 Tax=Tistrella mobilis TaxID=171437 RepID=UPI0016518C32|nr:hypothetical protein [Tistrella mobilis]